MGKPKKETRTAEELAEALAVARAAILAECEAKRAAGIELVGCFPEEAEGPTEYTPEEEARFRAIAKAEIAKVEAILGPAHMSAWERACRMSWAMGVHAGVISAEEPFVLAPKPEGWKAHEYK